MYFKHVVLRFLGVLRQLPLRGRAAGAPTTSSWAYSGSDQDTGRSVMRMPHRQLAAEALSTKLSLLGTISRVKDEGGRSRVSKSKPQRPNVS